MTAVDAGGGGGHRVKVLVAESLRQINSLRNFVAGVEVGAKIAAEMLTTMESHLLDCMDQIGEEP